METLAFGLLGSVVVMGCVVALDAAARRGRPTAHPESGTLVFRNTPFHRWGAVGAVVAAGAGVTAVAVVHPPEAAADVVSIALSYAMFVGLTGALVWDAFRLRLAVGPDGLDVRSPWRCRRFVRWADVRDVSFTGPLTWFEVRTTGGDRVRVPAHLGGLDAFLGACEEHLTPSQLEPALAAYVYLGRPFPGGGDR